jgi:hypothetical protein
MKYLKIFENFNKLPDFEFAIDIRNSTKEELNMISKEFEKYTDYVKVNDLIVAEISNDLDACNSSSIHALPWAWIIKIDNNFGKKIHYQGIVSRNFEIDEDIITLKEFLNVGLAGAMEYIELKKATNKYNL